MENVNRCQRAAIDAPVDTSLGWWKGHEIADSAALVVQERRDAMRAPGFSAESSLTEGRTYLSARPAVDPTEHRVSPAQSDRLSGQQGPRYVVDNSACPPGQRMILVPTSRRVKYCEVKRLVYDLGRMAWVWQTSVYPCGWEFVPSHWECQLPTLRVVG
jgi:hypothetical protein